MGKYKHLNKFVMEYLYFEFAYLKYRLHENEFFAFISGRYTITGLQTLDTL